MLEHEVEAYKDLHGEPFDELKGKAALLVLQDELVQIVTENLERQDQVLPESKGIQVSYNTLDVLRIVIIQSPDQPGLYLTLIIQFFIIFKRFQGNIFLLFVIEDSEYDSKGARTKFLDHFIAVAQMLIKSNDILLLAIVESKITFR